MSGEEDRASTASSVKGEDDDIHHMMAEVAAASAHAAVPSDLVMGAAYADNIAPAAIQEVIASVGMGLSNFSRIRNFIANTADSYKAAHDNVNKLLSQELLAGTGADSMASFWAGWGTLLQQIQLVNRQVATMHKSVRELILTPMAKFLDTERRKYETVKGKIDVYITTTAKLEKALEKSKAKCVKLIKASADQESKSSGRLALGSTLTAALGGGWGKALEASAEYEQQIEEVNTFYKAFHEREVPKAFSALQKIEESRGQMFASVLEQFSAIFQGFQAEILKVAPEIAGISSHIDVSHDIEYYISKTAMRFGSLSAVTARTYFTYDLPLSLKELEAKSIPRSAPSGPSAAASRKYPIDLTGTPDQIVNEQRRTFPDWSYRVPRIFLLLKRAVEDLGGLEREGIFRVSADYALVDAVYSKLQNAVYDVEIDNPHVAANCLKKWLRELSSPLIPLSSQGPIIAALDRASNATSAGQADSLNTAAEAVVKSVYESLPPATKLTIQGLVRLLRDISYPENSARTKMGLSNLAIVFGPSFLRPPEDFKDAALAIKAADRAGQLVMHLVHVVDVRDYPLDEEYAAASPLVRLVAPRERWRHAPLTLDGLEAKLPSGSPLDAKEPGRIGSAPPLIPGFTPAPPSGPGPSGSSTLRAAGSSPVVLSGTVPSGTPGLTSAAPLPSRPAGPTPTPPTTAPLPSRPTGPTPTPATTAPLPARPPGPGPAAPTSSFPTLSVAPPSGSGPKPPLPARPTPTTGAKPPLPPVPPSSGPTATSFGPTAPTAAASLTFSSGPGLGALPPGGLKIVHPTSGASADPTPSSRVAVSLPTLPVIPASELSRSSEPTTIPGPSASISGLSGLPGMPPGGFKIVHSSTPLVTTPTSLPSLPPTGSAESTKPEEGSMSHEMPSDDASRTSRPRAAPPEELIVSLSSREAQEAERGSTPHELKSPIAGLKMVGTQSDAIVAELAKRAGRGGLKSAPGLAKPLDLGEERVIDTTVLSPRTLEATQIGPPTPLAIEAPVGPSTPTGAGPGPLSPTGKPIGGIAIPILVGGAGPGIPTLRHVDREAEHSHDHSHDHGDGDIDPDEFKDKVNEKFSVKSLKERFAADKGKERRLSYVKRCPNCHSRVTNDKICYECYAKLDKPAEKATPA